MITATDNKLTGLIDGMSAADYHGADACSASRLKAMRRSPAHCRWELEHPRESEALKFGTAFHSYVFEIDAYRQGYAYEPEWGDCRRTENKLRRDAWRAANAGKEILSHEDAKTITYMANQLFIHPLGELLLGSPGRSEVSGFWTDPKTGLLCKLRADRLVEVPGVGRVCFDLKSTDDASPDGFRRAIHKWGYHISAAHYLSGLAQLGEPCDVYALAAVEKSGPFAVGIYAVDDPTVEQGARERERLMSVYAECVRSGNWPAYSNEMQKINVPAWAFDDDEI
jgi:hypothetical protein